MSEFPLQTPTSIRTERRTQTRSGTNAVAFPYMPTGETLVRWREKLQQPSQETVGWSV